MVSKVVIHCGAHKTASSYLQNCLREASLKIEEGNDSKILFRREMNQLSFFEEMKKKKRKCSIAASDELKSVAGDAEKLVITNEDFFSALHPDKFFHRLDEGLDYVASCFKDADVYYVIYTRNQADYVESLYLQQIHVGRPLSFWGFLNDKIPENLNWHDVTKRLSAYGDVTVIPYEDIKVSGEAAYYERFLSALDIANPDVYNAFNQVVGGRTQNRSYSQKAVDIFFKLHSMLDEDELVKLRKFLQNNFSTNNYPKPHFFDNREREKIKELYMESNSLLFADGIKGYPECEKFYIGF